MKTTNSNHQNEENSAPVHVADCGRVRAAVWQAEADGGLRYKITITRSIRQDDGTWKRGRTFFAGEIPAIVEVAARAQRWIERQQREAQAQLPLTETP
jgi:hypothetical protein